MSLLTIILMNIGLAVILSAILAAVMLAPRRLRAPFPGEEPHGAINVLPVSTATGMEPRRHPQTRTGRRQLRPVPDQ